jgi:NADPH:quinone reductase
MRALVCRAFGDYRSAVKVEDLPEPPLPPRGVRVAVEYASVSFAMSLWIAGKYQRKPPLPFIPGTEVTGTVIETAPGVTACKPGDRVLALLDWGGFAEQVCTTDHTVYRIPEGIDTGQALHLGISYGTAYGGLAWRAGLRKGETLLVLGASGAVGLAAVELGKVLGARVIGAAGGPAKCAQAKAHGADVTIDYTKDDLREAVKAVTGGRGVDCVFDPVGGAHFDAALRTLAAEGRLVVIGFASGTIPQIPANLLLVKNISVLGFNFGTYVGWSPGDEREQHEPSVRAAYEQIFTWCVEGRLKPVLAETFPLENYVDAQDAVMSRRALGKVALKLR